MRITVPTSIRLSDGSDGKANFKDLEYFTVLALANGDFELVKILLTDYGVDMYNLLTLEVLQLLYGYQSHEKNFPTIFHKFDKDKDYMNILKLSDEIKDIAEYIYTYNQSKQYEDGKDCVLNINSINKLRRKSLKDITDMKDNNNVKNPLWELS